MERLLRFSLEREHPIRLMWQEEDGTLCQSNAQVTELTENMVTFIRQRPRRTVVLPMERLLSADFKKGDDGML